MKIRNQTMIQFSTLKNSRLIDGCHSKLKDPSTNLGKIALVGPPNTGKSVLFHNLTGSYATVSNYPGTTVEVSRGRGRIIDTMYEVIDTPGTYSLFPLTEDERVTRTLLLNERPDVVIQIVDSKNLGRMLPFTLQLIEARLPLILCLNMMDEAQKQGITINVKKLEEELAIPVVATVATERKGIKRLKQTILNPPRDLKPKKIQYHPHIEAFLQSLSNLLKGRYTLSKRAIGLLLLQGDVEIWNLVKKRDRENYEPVKEAVNEVKHKFSHPLSFLVDRRRQGESRHITTSTLEYLPHANLPFKEKLSRFMINPVTGLPILLLVLYFGLYQFVGVFGAQTLVNFLEEVAFGEYINPFITVLFSTYIPNTVIRELFVGDYGIITLGVRYAIAIILPIVGTFFIAFSIIEDSGYLPRMALLIDRIFKKIGLNGRAVIPLILGLGCGTMATIVTRTLETKRERVIATFLLALAIPCSAQIGVLLGILVGDPSALVIWAFTLGMIFLLVGFLTARILPGEKASFCMEIPPLRLPKISNVAMKTYTRVEWYLKEVFPLFILASILIWLGQLTGVFDVIISGLAYPVHWIGLPKEASIAFLFGFFRRDYGAAGLYDLQRVGILSGTNLVVAAVTLTLFVPCIAHFSVSIRERGLKTALAMALFIFPFAFIVGFLLNLVLTFSRSLL